MPNYCFVYGTLKRGQANHYLVAAAARAIIPATVAGRLYDLGPFPALGSGDDRVCGELILIAPSLLVETLAVLDELEGYQPADPRCSIYRREVVPALTADGETMTASVYRYNRDTATLRYLPSGEWTGPSAEAITTRSGELIDFGHHVRYFRR